MNPLKHNEKPDDHDTMTTAVAPSRIALVLAAALCLAGCCRASLAQEIPPSPEDSAREVAAEVLRKAGEGGLGEWTRDVIGRALERAGRAASAAAAGAGSPAPLPAERNAGRMRGDFPARPNTAEVIVLISLSVPPASWRQWARDAARIGAPLVMRGVAAGSLRATVRRIGDRLGGHEAGVAIDPRLFRLFRVERVPAVVVVPGGVPPCASRGCAGDPAPPHDRVTGNIGLVAALETIAAEGSVGRDAARRHLQGLGGAR